VRECSDIVSGAKSKRPGLDQLLADARRRHFDILIVAAFDRIARNVHHFLEVLDELNRLGGESFIPSFPFLRVLVSFNGVQE
jgi:DNA invertase Pin-like site-specific DNA recombinase